MKYSRFWVVPPPSNSGNEGLGWDPLQKMVHNPGGDWYPGQGGQPKVDSLKQTSPQDGPLGPYVLNSWEYN